MAFSLIFLIGCSGIPNSSNNEDEIKYLVGMSQANLGEPWRVVMNDDIKLEAAKFNNLKIIFTDAAQDSQKQIRDVDKLLSFGIDLLLISPNEAEPLTPIVEKAYQSIPVIVIDRDIKSENYTMFIGADNKDIARQAGEFAVECLGEKGGNIIEIQGLPGSIPAKDRSEGFREIINKHSNIKIIDTIVADWLRDKAEDELIKKLNNYDSKIDLIYAHNDPMALGAYRAAQRLGIKDIMYIGIDGLQGKDGGIQMVSDGILKATFVYPTGGKEAVDYAIKLLNHESNFQKRLTLESNKIIK
jgi:ABC-type sugar transport system substrate-binding protein